MFSVNEIRNFLKDLAFHDDFLKLFFISKVRAKSEVRDVIITCHSFMT